MLAALDFNNDWKFTRNCVVGWSGICVWRIGVFEFEAEFWGIAANWSWCEIGAWSWIDWFLFWTIAKSGCAKNEC